METIGQRLKKIRTARGLSQAKLADRAGVSQGTIGNIESEQRGYGESIVDIAAALQTTPRYLRLETDDPSINIPTSTPNARPLDMPIRSSDEDGVRTYQIEYWDAKGSCGGGSHNDDATIMGYLAKEPTWFQRYHVKPEDAVAVTADGFSMADFIIDGDIVIFDRSKTTPQSGFIFLIEHPDGLRIKQLRRDINGAWILESRNPNKAQYPDEIIPPEKGELLIIKGRFVYRQGG